MLRLALSALLAVLVWQSPVAHAQAARSPRNANYALDATLDTATWTLAGSGRITWTNRTTAPARDLRLHLYWNAWRDNDSSWMREQRLGRNARLLSRPDDDRGSIDLRSLSLEGDDLLSRAAFIAPDDGNPLDRTMLAVPLDRPVAPGATVAIDMTWTARVPRTFARTGRLGDYVFIAHWFPKLGVFEASGEWNAHQFHAATEFFSDFGAYDVRLTLPEGWVVGATGALRASEPGPAPGQTTHVFAADDVHDFAWTASPHFLDLTGRFDHPGLPPVTMRLLLQPEHAAQADRHFTAARAALRYFGEWFGPYPYDRITIVDPIPIVNAASQGESTGGMEYPMLFTAGTRYLAPRRGLQPESVTIHEAGHQFWQGIVATNEFEHAWMDEGLTTWATARVIDEALPRHFVAVERYFGGLFPWAFTDVPWSRDIDGNRLNPYRLVATADVTSAPTWRYWPGTASQMSYNKTALWLATLERHLGWPVMQRVLSTYFSRHAFGHPVPDDFFAVASEVAGTDLTWFFDATVRSSAAFDYAVAQVTRTPVDGGSESVVVVRRLEDGVFPVSVRCTFADGSTAMLSWDGRDRWTAFTQVTPAPLVRVEVDPDRVLLLDRNYTNNSWTASPAGGHAARKWSLRWLGWLQELMVTYAFFS